MKRGFDLFLAALLLVPCLIFVGILSSIILVVDHFSPFHIQERVGRGGKLFRCWKLQTMRPARNAMDIGEREKDGDRLTRLGAFLRDHGWDEIPQLMNVLRGDMSFVGPRPLLPKTLNRIRGKNEEAAEAVKEWEHLRSRVRPGITGWHQVHDAGVISLMVADGALECLPLWRRFQIILVTIAVFFVGKKARRA